MNDPLLSCSGLPILRDFHFQGSLIPKTILLMPLFGSIKKKIARERDKEWLEERLKVGGWMRKVRKAQGKEPEIPSNKFHYFWQGPRSAVYLEKVLVWHLGEILLVFRKYICFFYWLRQKGGPEKVNLPVPKQAKEMPVSQERLSV